MVEIIHGELCDTVRITVGDAGFMSTLGTQRALLMKRLKEAKNPVLKNLENQRESFKLTRQNEMEIKNFINDFSHYD